MAELKLTLKWQKKQADRRQKDHPNFKVGDKVWLLRKNIATTHPCAKLDYIGPFKIAKLVGLVACQLELPPQFKIHNVFHVSLLKPYYENPIPERHRKPPAPEKLKAKKSLKFGRSWTPRRFVESSCTLSFGEVILLLKLLGSLLET
jgi:hypothetical protein